MAIKRLTKQKQEFKRFFECNRDKEMTIAEIAEKLKEFGSEMGIATVYRAVNRLEEEGLLIKTSLGSSNKATYRYVDTDESVRNIHRLFCNKCGNILDIKTDFIDKLENSIADNTGYAITDHQIMFYGLCPYCKNINAN